MSPTNSLLFFKSLAELGVGVRLTPEQAKEISEALFSIPNLDTVMDLQTEIAILKDEKHMLVQNIVDEVTKLKTYSTVNSGMGFPSYDENHDAAHFKRQVLKLIEEKYGR